MRDSAQHWLRNNPRRLSVAVWRRNLPQTQLIVLNCEGVERGAPERRTAAPKR
jgi:hypothetical protein